MFEKVTVVTARARQSTVERRTDPATHQTTDVSVLRELISQHVMNMNHMRQVALDQENLIIDRDASELRNLFVEVDQTAKHFLLIIEEMDETHPFEGIVFYVFGVALQRPLLIRLIDVVDQAVIVVRQPTKIAARIVLTKELRTRRRSSVCWRSSPLTACRCGSTELQ